MPSTYYTEDEAKRKIGKEIKTLYMFASVPEGSIGKVTGIFETPIPRVERFGVYVTWNLPGFPFVDGFNRTEYEQFLEEIQEEIRCLCKDCKMAEQMCRHKETGASTPEPILLLAVTLDQIEKEEKTEEKNPEYHQGILSTVTRIRETFRIPKPKGR